MEGREKRNEDKDGIMTRVKACEEKTPDRSSSIFAGFSNPRASTNRKSEGQELYLYFERKSPVQPILSMNKSSCNFKQKAIWQLAPENQCSKETDTARRGWTPVTRFKFHAKGTPDGPEIEMFSDTKNTRVFPANGREFQINGTRSFNYSNQQ